MSRRAVTERDQRQPLLLGDEESFVSYDDDDLAAAARLRKKRERIRLCAWVTVGVFLIALVGVGLYFGTHSIHQSHKTDPGSLLGKYQHAAVASDVTECSEIGRDILKKSGGNAVDAAIASLLCMGLADPQSMGIGGGFFMTIYNKTSGKGSSIDAREIAPLAATTDMFYHGASPSKGGLSIAVPGELKGYELAWKNFGTLPWKDLFTPAILMAKNGFKVPMSLQLALEKIGKKYKDMKDMRAKLPVFSETYVNPDTDSLYREGEILKLPRIGKTLETLSEEGAQAFYNGSLTKAVLEDMAEHNSGAIITAEDLIKYEPKLTSALTVTLRNGFRIHTPQPPSGGVVLSFILNVLEGEVYSTPQPPSGGVVLSFILNILEGFNMTSEMLKSLDGTVLAYHRITEAFKFAYAKRTDLGDPAFVPIEELVKNLTSRDYSDYIRSLIWDNQTQPVDYYGPSYYDQNKTSTAHLSIVDQNGNAVSVTSTVNTRFGSEVFGSQTGIIFNDEMDDFATSNKPNDFGAWPSPANKIRPGKRPLSSMCPAVFVDKEGDVRLVVGAAGGIRITTATAFVATRTLWLGDNIQEAINALRIHHQLLPPVLSYETGTDQAVIDGLKAKGHNVTEVDVGKSMVQGITRVGETLYANSDYRKGGTTAGY